jgi:hypothetical protein
MEHIFCGTVWSTYKVKNNEHTDGRRHGCRFPRHHRGSICMCVCGKAHKNIDKPEEATNELVDERG